LFAACDKMGVRRPNVWITECGWTLNSMPGNEQAKQDIDYLARLYGAPAEIRGASLWTLQSGRGNGALPQRLNALMPWLTEYTLTTDIPGAALPPPVDPPATGDNMLQNPSFDDGWTDSASYSTTQNPTGWTVEWGSGTNPHGGQPYELGEAVHKSRAMLPEAERDVFIWDGTWSLKVFAGGRSIWPRLKQTVTLSAGRYRLTTPVWVDTYKWDGGKDYATIDPLQTEWQVKVNGAALGDWLPLPAGGQRTPSVDFEHAGGRADIAVHFRCNWAISNNLWLDGWALAAVDTAGDPPPPAPGKHKAIILKVPQDVSFAEWQDAADYAYTYRHTMTASHDDMITLLQGGNADSYVKLLWPGRQPATGELVNDLGYRWERVPELDDGPLDGLTLGHPFAYRYVLTSAFGAQRDYGLHEGADYDILGGAADNVVDVLAVYRGTVERVVPAGTGNYGNYVRLRHERNGQPFLTWYCHLDKTAVVAGQVVAQGQPVGEVGSTGKVTGEHVHLNLVVPGRGLDGYVVDDVVDPEPYMPRGRMALPQYTSQAPTIDLLPYLRGDGRMYEVRHPDGKTETFQSQRDGDWWFYQVKNSQWEQLYADNTYIWRGYDTSPGEGRFYIQWEPGQVRARWCPRNMRVGQAWVGAGHQVQFYRKSDCQPDPNNSGNATNTMRLVAWHTSKTWNGITVPDVVEMTNGTEVWFYARGYGLVAWSTAWGQSAIIQVYQAGERPSLVREKINCM
jgi:murein DD-endopeptidase MepM/ murein hydrolase activator NlpD